MYKISPMQQRFFTFARDTLISRTCLLHSLISISIPKKKKIKINNAEILLEVRKNFNPKVT